MEIKILINEKNKKEVLNLIDQLVTWESRAKEYELMGSKNVHEPKLSEKMSLQEISSESSVYTVEPKIEKSLFGSWGMFNSFVPGKAALRIVVNMLGNERKEVLFSELIDECLRYFLTSGLGKYRGFPKKTSESARGRLANHLIEPYHDMGLIRIFGEGKNHRVAITKDGLEFAKLSNPLLDQSNGKKYLSEEESNWILQHLEAIDKKGFKEYSVLKSLTIFLSKQKRSYEDIVTWFKNDGNFVEWVKKGSRYENDPKAFSKQLENVARTIATGKIAILRELGLLKNKRGDYSVIKNI